MASFFDEISRNRLKSILLLGLFFLLFIGIIYLLVLILGGGLIALAIGAILVAIYAAVSYFWGSKMVLKISGAKAAERKDYPYLFDIIEGLAMATQMKMPDVYIVNDQNPNAFATGRNRNHASVAVTSGLIAMMDKRELQGVLAHEMSHIQNNDILFMMIAVVFAGVIGIVAVFVRGIAIFGGIGRRNSGPLIIIALVIGILAPIFALLLKLAISRRREYMADANGARLIRDPPALASALTKIQQYSAKPAARPVAKANEITASLYFSNPLTARQSVSNIFSTHPPIEERIKRLKQMY